MRAAWTLLVLSALLVLGTARAYAASSECPEFMGTFDGTYGVMRLHPAGARIVGTYTIFKHPTPPGQVNGVVTGNVFNGTIVEGALHTTLHLVLADDNRWLSGTWQAKGAKSSRPWYSMLCISPDPNAVATPLPTFAVPTPKTMPVHTVGLPAGFKPCYKNAGAYAAAGPCFGPAGTTIHLELLRPMPKPPAQLLFIAVVTNGVPATVYAPLAGSGNVYSLSAPVKLCTGPIFPHKWMIWLADASGAKQGEIGQFTMTGCP
jgi:hypothetical protein